MLNQFIRISLAKCNIDRPKDGHNPTLEFLVNIPDPFNLERRLNFQELLHPDGARMGAEIVVICKPFGDLCCPLIRIWFIAKHIITKPGACKFFRERYGI